MEEAVFDALSGEPAPDLLLTALRDAAGRPATPLLRRVHAAFPCASVVVYGALSPQLARDLLGVARCGVTEVALHDFDDLQALVVRVLRRASTRHIAELALAAVDGRLSRVTRPVVGYCLSSAHSPRTVEDVASMFGVCRKTVASWLRADGLPPCSALVGWGRVLLAARYLEDMERSVERIAFTLGFESGSALRHMMLRYTHLRTAEIRARGGFAGVLPLFTDELTART